MNNTLTKFDYLLALCMCVVYAGLSVWQVIIGEHTWATVFCLVALWFAVLLVLSFVYPLNDDDDSVQEPLTASETKTDVLSSYWSPEADGTWVLYRNGQRVRCYTCGRDVYFLQPSTSVQIECKCGGPTLIIPNQPDHTS